MNDLYIGIVVSTDLCSSHKVYILKIIPQKSVIFLTFKKPDSWHFWYPWPFQNRIIFLCFWLQGQIYNF